MIVTTQSLDRTTPTASPPAPRHDRPTAMTAGPDDQDANAPDERRLDSLLALLEDDHARAILTATSVEPMSAAELSDHCDVSQTTVYRRVERLVDAGLVAERTRPRADGHHDTVYVARLDELSVRLRGGTLEFDVTRRSDDVADRLTRLWEGF